MSRYARRLRNRRKRNSLPTRSYAPGGRQKLLTNCNILLYKHFGGLAALYADYNTCCGTLEAYTLEIVILYCTFGFAYSHIFYAGTGGEPYFGFHIHSKLLDSG